MKDGFLMMLVCLILAMTASNPLQGASVPWTEWHNALKPKGDAIGPLTLSENGRALYRIVIPTSSSPQDLKASSDLSDWLQELTGATFPIVTDDQGSQEKEISVGRTSLLQGLDAGLVQKDLGDEGYAIAVKGERIFLWGGKKRGAINAVYALLEEDLGCRWYSDKAFHMPRTSSLSFSPVPRSYVPRLKIRDPFYKVSFDGTWSLRNHTNAPDASIPEEWGGHMDYALFVHTVHSLVPPDAYFKDHPEYFMMDEKGNRITRQLCMTNAGAIAVAQESAVRILKEKPHSEIICVSKMDGGGTCLCENCKKLDEAEGSDMASCLSFVNQVADAVEKECPEVIVSTLAYLETVPVPKTIRPRHNVAIRLCTDRCMWSYPFTPAEADPAFRDSVLEWAKVHNRIHIWDYVVNFSHYTAPMPNMDVIAANIRFFVANNAEGIMTQGAYQSPGAERDLLRSWVIGKLLWDPSLDEQALTQDFIWGYFGHAAPAIAQYNALLQDSAEQHRDSLAAPDGGIRYPMDSPFLSKEFLEKATACYEEALSLAENEEIRRRVDLDSLPILYVKLCRGPEFVGKDYGDILARFERIARSEGVTHIYEGPPDLDQKLQAWKDSMK